MKHALDHWKDIRSRIDGRDLFLFCDFDGTLTPVRPRPGLAILNLSRRNFLERLACAPGLQLAFVSGRALADLKAKVPVKGAVYSGNHGLEASGAGFEFLVPLPPRWRRTLLTIKRFMRPLERAFPGILVEDKSLTISIHYRRVAGVDQAACREEIMARIARWEKTRGVILHHGKKVVEIRPPVAWNKGSIIKWFLRRRSRRGVVPIFIGDDISDEDGFRAIAADGITIHVGDHDWTHAAYRLDHVTDVYRFLRRMMDMKISKTRRKT